MTRLLVEETDKCHSLERKVFTGEELLDCFGKFMPCSVKHQLHKHSTQEGVCAPQAERKNLMGSLCVGQKFPVVRRCPLAFQKCSLSLRQWSLLLPQCGG